MATSTFEVGEHYMYEDNGLIFTIKVTRRTRCFIDFQTYLFRDGIFNNNMERVLDKHLVDRKKIYTNEKEREYIFFGDDRRLKIYSDKNRLYLNTDGSIIINYKKEIKDTIYNNTTLPLDICNIITNMIYDKEMVIKEHYNSCNLQKFIYAMNEEQKKEHMDNLNEISKDLENLRKA